MLLIFISCKEFLWGDLVFTFHPWKKFLRAFPRNVKWTGRPITWNCNVFLLENNCAVLPSSDTSAWGWIIIYYILCLKFFQVFRYFFCLIWWCASFMLGTYLSLSIWIVTSISLFICTKSKNLNLIEFFLLWKPQQRVVYFLYTLLKSFMCFPNRNIKVKYYALVLVIHTPLCWFNFVNSITGQTINESCFCFMLIHRLCKMQYTTQDVTGQE